MLTLEEQVGQMLLVGFNGLTAPDYLVEWLREGRIGGVILFARNVDTPEQVAAMTREIHQAAKHGALVAIDQEGGTVARLRGAFTESPGAMALSASGDEGLTEAMSHVLAAEMQALGINWTYAPVLDISYNHDNPTVGTRSYGSDKEQVSLMASAAARGFQAGGVAACAKHFPGLGNTAVDTHLALAVVDATVDHLLHHDLVPYRAAIDTGLASIMTTHTVFPALDADLPATLSPVIVQRLLRESLRFDGVVTSDCMEMKAISSHHSAGEAAVLGALAGLDVVLFSHTREVQEQAYAGLLEAARSGRVPIAIIERANERIGALKAQFAAADAAARIDAAQIRTPEHLETAQQAARAGTVLLKADSAVFPLSPERHSVSLIEFASYFDSEVLEGGGLSGLGTLLQEEAPQITVVGLKSSGADEATLQRAYAAAKTEVLVLATRNAHLYPAEIELARALMGRAGHVILLALRNPYDAAVLDADTVLCTCGDAAPSLQAAVDALFGRFVPAGSLPVTLG